ncbi:MAG: phosphoribosylanthranilate isomerase [Tannerella sp.]|nr:phosphoribosylanthranilate isomerase [Tannerella sp.]
MKIKVCGMREAANIRAVERLDVDWMGFIFYPPSPRHVSGSEADAEAIRRCGRTKVGVFVDAPVGEMAYAAARYGLDCLQLHGSESPDTCRAVQTLGYPVIKAFHIADADDLKRTADYDGAASFFLFDTKCDGFGGSGRRFDWSALHAYDQPTPFILSGGITPQCADELLRFRHPAMIGADLNSGFELAPALKDAGALDAFIRKLKPKHHASNPQTI